MFLTLVLKRWIILLLRAHATPSEKCPLQALKAGKFASEIIPVEIDGAIISVDDTIRPGVTVSSLSTLKPVFPQWGPGENLGQATTTAGNASGVGDGAALCILTTRSRAQQEGWDILGKWVWSSVVGVEPRVMGIAPVVAIPKLLKSTGLKKEDVDVWEINEAFASQFAYCVENLGVPMEKINPK
jgi:acetyl-CoA acyltransferase 1